MANILSSFLNVAFMAIPSNRLRNLPDNSGSTQMNKHRASLFAFFGVGFVVPLILYLAFMVFAVWGIGSAITSGVKAMSDSCGKRYPVEAFFSGDWFCPEMEK